MSDGLKLLAAVLQNGSVETLRKLDDSLFMDEEKAVFAFVKQHYRRYAQLPAFETAETETGVRLPDITEQVRYYEKRVRDRKMYVVLSEGFGGLRDALKTNNMDAAREQIALLGAMARENSADEDLRDLRQASRSALASYDHAKENPGISGVPSGWPGLDEQTGGYQDGDLVSIIGRMGLGKTYLLLKQAEYAWEVGYNVLVISMEMTIEQLAQRLIGMQSGINPKYIRKGALSTVAERRLRHVVQGLAHTDRFHFYAGGFSKRVDDVEVLMQEFDPDATYIDSAYLLQPESKRSMHRLERIPEVMDRLKKITITQNRPIIQTSQFSRAAGKKGKEGSLENIGFTDVIALHSSLVMAIKEGRPPYQSSRRLIELLKGREGEQGLFQTNYQFTPPNFDEVPLEVQRAEAVSLDWMYSGNGSDSVT